MKYSRVNMHKHEYEFIPNSKYNTTIDAAQLKPLVRRKIAWSLRISFQNAGALLSNRNSIQPNNPRALSHRDRLVFVFFRLCFCPCRLCSRLCVETRARFSRCASALWFGLTFVKLINVARAYSCSHKSCTMFRFLKLLFNLLKSSREAAWDVNALAYKKINFLDKCACGENAEALFHDLVALI